MPLALFLRGYMTNSLFSLVALGETIVTSLNGALGKVWYLVLVNFFGVVAIVLKITETQNKKRSAIIFFAVLNYLCWIIYFLLNGDFTSSIVNLVGFAQTLIFLQRSKHKWANSIFWLIFFLAVQLVLSVFIWRGPLSLFSICAGLVSTVAYYVIDENKYRICFLVLILLWIGNGIAYFYPVALIHDAFAAISITIAIVRYNILGKKAKKEKVVPEETLQNDSEVSKAE